LGLPREVEAGPQESFKVKEDVVGITDGNFAEKIDFGAAGELIVKETLNICFVTRPAFTMPCYIAIVGVLFQFPAKTIFGKRFIAKCSG